MYKWIKSPNHWVRRASIISFIRPLRNQKFSDDVYKVAQLLINDKDDLVQKGFGWALRDTGKIDRKRLFNWLYERKTIMPRIALRYAIEKFPQDWKNKIIKL